MWSPSVIIAVTALGLVDLSSIITAQRYADKLKCELDVKAGVKAILVLYPTLQIKFAACVKKAD
jgi:hypothetical protein